MGQGQAFKKGDVVGVLINRDTTNPDTSNTISLFVNGARASDPVPIPEALLAGPLYPHVSFKGAMLLTNFRTIFKPLPFTVRMLGDAAAEDVVASTVKASVVPEIVFP